MAGRISINTEAGRLTEIQRIAKQGNNLSGGMWKEEKTAVFDCLSVEKKRQTKAGMEEEVLNFFREARRKEERITIWAEGEETSGRDIIADLADDMGSGIYLIVSESFLESMKAGKESFHKKSQILLDVMCRLSTSFPAGTTAGAYIEENQAVFWEIPDRKVHVQSGGSMILEDKQRNSTSNPYGESVNSLRIRAACGPVSYNAAAAYAKLAHAKNKAAVQNVMQQTRRQITALRLLVSFSNGEEAAKAKAMLRSYQKLLLRGNTKLQHLSEAHLTEQKRERAVEKKEEEKAAFLADQVRRKRVSQNIRDSVLVKEGQLEQLQIPGYYKRKSNSEDSFPAMPQSSAVSISWAPAVLGEGMPQDSAGGEFSVVEIQHF